MLELCDGVDDRGRAALLQHLGDAVDVLGVHVGLSEILLVGPGEVQRLLLLLVLEVLAELGGCLEVFLKLLELRAGRGLDLIRDDVRRHGFEGVLGALLAADDIIALLLRLRDLIVVRLQIIVRVIRIGPDGLRQRLDFPAIAADLILDLPTVTDHRGVLPDGGIHQRHIDPADQENVYDVNQYQLPDLMRRDEVVDAERECREEHNEGQQAEEEFDEAGWAEQGVEHTRVADRRHMVPLEDRGQLTLQLLVLGDQRLGLPLDAALHALLAGMLALVLRLLETRIDLTQLFIVGRRDLITTRLQRLLNLVLHLLPRLIECGRQLLLLLALRLQTLTHLLISSDGDFRLP